MKKICFVITTDFVVKVFLLNHLRALTALYEVTVIVNTNNSNFLKELGIDANVIPLDIARNISLKSDFSCLIKLIKIFRNHKFSAIHSVTPKAGLLAMLAAWIVRVPLRVHTFTGQVWAVKVGIKRYLLKKIDYLIASITTHNLVDSPSQLQFLLGEKVFTHVDKAIVFEYGSISGVDLGKFKPDQNAKKNVRERFNISEKSIVFLFIGRLTIDKGVLDLSNAFKQLNSLNSHLLIVGPDEQQIQSEILSNSSNANLNIHFVGHNDEPQIYMAAADVICLPSYREGFGTVIIEAAAVGVPAIASRIYGLTDAVVEGETGLMHEVHDVMAIKNCMGIMISNEFLRLKLGEQARVRANKYFDSNLITQKWVNFYRHNISKH